MMNASLIGASIGITSLVSAPMTFGRGLLIAFFGFWGMFVLRQLGWMLSRTVLYTTGWPVCIILLLAWGAGIAFGFRHLVLWLQFGWYSRRSGTVRQRMCQFPTMGCLMEAHFRGMWSFDTLQSLSCRFYSLSFFQSFLHSQLGNP